MIITSNRYTADNGRPAYRFFATMEEEDLSILSISDRENREYAEAKIREVAVGHTVAASYGYDQDSCNMYGFDSKGYPVFTMRPPMPNVALTLEHGDPLRGIEPKLNPEYRQWEAVRNSVDFWCGAIARRFFQFANAAFFPEFAGGPADRTFRMDVKEALYEEITGRKRKRKEPPAEPAEEPGEPPVGTGASVPNTMPELWRMLGRKETSTYDFGRGTLSPAGKRPGLDGCRNAYRKNLLLTVARALLLRKFGVEVSSADVKASAVSAWKTNVRVNKYSEVMKSVGMDEANRRAVEALKEVERYIDGKVDSTMKCMSKFVGERWSLSAFVTYCKASGIIEFRKAGWRSKKEQKFV